MNKFESCNPVAMFYFSATFEVVLTADKVPHKVSPIHKVELIGEEELEVFELGRHIYHDSLACLRIAIWYIVSFDIYPLLVAVGILRTVHSWEKHILFVGITCFARNRDV